MRLIQNHGGLQSAGCRAWSVLLFVLVLCLDAGDAQAQWEPEVRLTNAPDSSLAISWYNAIAVSGSSVHVVWADKRSGNWEIYHKRSVDNGVHWGEDVLLSANGSSATRMYKPMPSIAVSGSKVHVVWHSDRTGTYEIYYQRSFDGGDTWDGVECLFDDMIWSWMPSIAVLGNTVHLAWSDAREGKGFTVNYLHSTDDGRTWGEVRRLSDAAQSASALGAKMEVSESRVYVTWYYWITNLLEEAQYRLSTDGGDTWWPEGTPTGDSESTTGLSVRQSQPYIYYFWIHRQSGLWNLHYRHSSNAGLRWNKETTLKLQQADYLVYSYSVSGAVVHLAWKDDVNGLGVVRYSCSTDAGENWAATLDMSPFDTGGNYPNIANSGSTIHILWTDYRDGAGEIYYRRNPTGNPVSVESNDAPVPADIALDQNFPNPFHGSSSVRFAVPQRSHVILTLHDLLGRRVTTLREGEAGAGSHHARIDASGLPAGSYLLRFSCEGQQRTRLITVLR